MTIKRQIYPPYTVLLIMYIMFIVFALIVDSPMNILLGLKKIILTPDILITDYMEIGGIGAAFVNAALTSIISIAILVFIGIKPNGSTIMALWLMTGFSFFGKNILNIWPIMLGVYLFSRYQKEPFLNYTLVALLSTTLAPTVSQLSFTGLFTPGGGFIIGNIIGIFTGFILAPIAAHCIKAHNGYNLYNIGFASGLLATLLMSILRGVGIDFDTRLIWYTGSNGIFTIFLFIICIYLIAIGLIYGENNKLNLKGISKQSGRLVSDFYLLFGPSTYINMGILGLASTTFVLLIKGDLNGPTICAIFTIMGFGCFGKHLKNISPVIIGACLAAFIRTDPLNSPNIILSILFSTALAPISGKFGWKIGLLAGFLHLNMVTNIGYLHGGLNLYNNGLAAGFVAMILIPSITTFKKEL
ncbi:DUF1576 domain-containing protein [Clostridium gasigenes]|uniref:DUF1576 domain-containing protein n=1 Tax=Clostridium gasigenes TaxID=94869 RepID=UPI001C0CAC00|nr:DUF1576 domain-containing protein [Clostridium gasigenes]MBU3107796.1 DUF1576 domain-containing protein [Clostridium gasigenes]